VGDWSSDVCSSDLPALNVVFTKYSELLVIIAPNK
jgi:hypothetical protein